MAQCERVVNGEFISMQLGARRKSVCVLVNSPNHDPPHVELPQSFPQMSHLITHFKNFVLNVMSNP